jgi:hypothetical protein
MPRHHVFFSYARRDNAPVAPGQPGWVSAFERRLREQHRRRTGRELRIFFDQQAIDEGRDWRRELGTGLRDSQLFIAFLSPAYLTSPYCQWEWEEYLRREHRLARGDDGIAQVFFVLPQELQAGDDPRAQALLADLRRRQQGSCVLQPWRELGPQVLERLEALEASEGERDAAARSQALKAAPRDPAEDTRPLAERLDELQRRLMALERHVGRRLDRIALADLAPGNLPRSLAHFVGRHHELRALHDVMTTGAQRGPDLAHVGGRSIIAAAHSPGGLGKTALARQYAHAYADHYATGGSWELRCEGASHLGRVLLQLAQDPVFLRLGDELAAPAPGWRLSEAARQDDAQALAEVLGQLHAVATVRVGRIQAALRHLPEAHSDADDLLAHLHLAPRVLLILDNVDQPALLSAPSLAALPQAEWLELLVTTRLDPARHFGAGVWATPLEIQPLPEADALELLREHQPDERFASAEDEAAAREIVQALGGYTLAVELVAAYLGGTAELGYGPRDYLQRLREDGLASVDELAGTDEVAGRLQHAEQQVARVLAWSHARLSEPAKTVLTFARRLLPDRMPLDWLRQLTTRRHPDTLADAPGRPSPWAKVWQELHSLRLLHLADVDDGSAQPDRRRLPTLVRIHRLVAAALPVDGFDPQEDLETFFDAFTDRFEAEVGQGGDLWLRSQHPLLRDHLGHLIDQSAPSAPLLRSALVCANFEGEHGSLGLALALTTRVLAGMEDLLRANPGSAQAARDVSVSLNRLADFRLRRGQPGDADAALGLYERSLQVREDLMRANPGSAQAARDLGISLERLAECGLASDDRATRAEGLQRQLQAVDLYRQLAERQAGQYAALKDVARGLLFGAQYALALGQSEIVEALLSELVQVLSGWVQRGGELHPAMAGLLARLTGGRA